MGVACAILASCGGGPTAPHGSPVLLHVYWVAGGIQFPVWAREPDAQLAAAVPAFGSEIDFVFDRRLDGNRIEDTVTTGGVVMTVPKDVPPVSVDWPGQATPPGHPEAKLQVRYNSVPRFDGQSSYVFARPGVPGFPSSETITFHLDPANLASAYGEPMDGPAEVIVKTAAFAVSVGVPTSDGGAGAAVATNYQVPLIFSNRLPSDRGTGSAFVHVRTGDVDVPYKLLADANVLSRWYVAPADCLRDWPADATLDVTVDPGLGDAFGRTLPEGATGRFTTRAAAGVVPDAACPPPEAGASDGAAPEAGADTGADAGAAPDASLDGAE
jgi:hypothetical protein